MSRCARCFGNIHDFAVFCPHCAQVHEPDFDRLINQIIGDRYRIYRRLGQGGLSTIFAANDLQTDQAVVVKVSDPAQLARRELSYAIEADEARRYWAEMIERMRREAETLATIQHPNIVRFIGTGVINDDLRYVVMEYLRGRTLRREIDGKGRLDMSETIRIALEVLSGLSEVHSRGIIHRDINPRNIYIADCGLRIADCETHESYELVQLNQSAIRNPQSAIKLIDFGIAKFPQPPGAPPFTQHSVMSGTVAYASPEQCQSRPIDHRADIYSLGVVLYEMLTGQRPFNGRTPTEIALKQIQAEPKPPRAINPDLPAGLERAVLRALAKNPNERQQNVEELAREIQHGANQIVIPLRQSSESEREATISCDDSIDPGSDDHLKLVRKRRRRSAVAVAALLFAISVSGILLGRHLIHSPTSRVPENAAATISPSPTATQPSEQGFSALGSDADEMEMAARLSQTGIGTGNTSTQTIKSATQTGPIAKPSPSGNADVSRAPVTSHPATPAPPKANPKTPPAPQPTVVATRMPQPGSEPEISQAPRKEESNQSTRPTQHENDDVAAQNRRPAERPSDSGKAGKDRRASGITDDNNRNENGVNDENGQQIGPKIIQWNGSVDRERVVKIEMPGVPGTIEIPRIYRNRVGVVEPPSSSNGWGCAVLRVFGRGNISIIVRWWPIWKHSSKVTAKN